MMSVDANITLSKPDAVEPHDYRCSQELRFLRVYFFKRDLIFDGGATTRLDIPGQEGVHQVPARDRDADLF